MDSEKQKYYLDELLLQCQFALDAYSDLQRLSTLLRNKRKKHTSKDSRDLFRNLHSLFTHAGNISKLLFPSKDKQRGEYLRKLLGLSKTGHLLANRTFRNHLEHYDERLDTWINEWIRNNYPEYFNTVGLLGSENTHQVSIIGQEEMRVFNYSNMRFIFQNEPFDIMELAEVIKELSDVLIKLGADYQPKQYSITFAELGNGSPVL